MIASAAIAALALAQPLAVAQDFWHDRGVQPCPAPQVRFAPMPDPFWDAYTDRIGGCEITIAPSFLKGESRDLCAVLVHELGHTAGLAHTPTGVMAGNGGDEIPYACRRALPRKLDEWGEPIVRTSRRARAGRSKGARHAA